MKPPARAAVAVAAPVVAAEVAAVPEEPGGRLNSFGDGDLVGEGPAAEDFGWV